MACFCITTTMLAVAKEPGFTTADSKRILLIDDEDTILTAVGGALERQGYVVDRASNLASARRALDDTGFDLVITDLCLSDAAVEEGLLIIEHAHAHCPQTPVVVLTGYGSPQAEQEARQRGARGFFSKSERLVGLLGTVRALLGPAVPRNCGGREA
jgi:DNA-binding NtrC family response regulator